MNQVESLEREALEILCLVRSVKNSFAPINRIPPEVLSLIPDHYGENGEAIADRGFITLTHVCRGWRDIFTSCPSLWARFDFKNVDKTRTYIQRSQSSPLRIHIGYRYQRVVDEAFLLITPHIFRIKSLTIDADALPSELKHFRCNTPLLEKLDINIASGNPVLDGTLFNGDLSSLRELRLQGITTNLPWKNLANLQVVDLRYRVGEGYGVTQLLDFFESAPLLHTVTLQYSMLDTSDAPPERIVPLHTRVFTIKAALTHLALLLRHLYIPIGASLVLEFHSSDEGSLFPGYFPERSLNFGNLSDITVVNLLFSPYYRYAQLNGPSGSLRVLARWGHWKVGLHSYTTDYQILRTFSHSMLLAIQRLSISEYEHPRPPEVEECPVSQTLSFTSNLRTLTLVNCNNQPFILALDPPRSPSSPVLCPNMRQLVLYNSSLYQLDIQHLIDMARNRASRGVKLSSITISGQDGLALEKERELLKLREYVTHMEYRAHDLPPVWDHFPGGNCAEGEQVREVVFR